MVYHWRRWRGNECSPALYRAPSPQRGARTPRYQSPRLCPRAALAGGSGGDHARGGGHGDAVGRGGRSTAQLSRARSAGLRTVWALAVAHSARGRRNLLSSGDAGFYRPAGAPARDRDARRSVALLGGGGRDRAWTIDGADARDMGGDAAAWRDAGDARDAVLSDGDSPHPRLWRLAARSADERGGRCGGLSPAVVRTRARDARDDGAAPRCTAA